MIRAALLVWTFLSLAAGAALAAGDAAAGKAKSAVCVACHGPDGNSINPEWPSIAGQNERYLSRQLAAFKAGKARNNVLMMPMSVNLSEQDMADLAAYYASLPRRGMLADENELAKIEAGEQLYRGGNKEKGIAACMGCHGPDGAGNALAGFPSLSNQHATYTAMQLKAFRSGERTSDLNRMMRDVAARLSDEEIEQLALYLTALE